jgi:hypothetical protein
MQERKGTGVNMRLLNFLPQKKCFFLSYIPAFNGQYCLVKYTEKKNFELLEKMFYFQSHGFAFQATTVIGDIILFLRTSYHLERLPF